MKKYFYLKQLELLYTFPGFFRIYVSCPFELLTKEWGYRFRNPKNFRLIFICCFTFLPVWEIERFRKEFFFFFFFSSYKIWVSVCVYDSRFNKKLFSAGELYAIFSLLWRIFFCGEKTFTYFFGEKRQLIKFKGALIFILLILFKQWFFNGFNFYKCRKRVGRVNYMHSLARLLELL